MTTSPDLVRDPLDSRADRRFCEEMLPRVSRTFALSISMLPRTLRDAVGTSYLMCRLVDCIEDDARLSPAAREALFEAFDGLVHDDGLAIAAFEAECARVALGSEGAERELCRGSGAVLRSFRRLPLAQRDAVRPHVLEMSRGMREHCRIWARDGKLRIADLDGLERYCYFVAGTVGELLTELFELHVPSIDERARAEVRAHAVSFGLGLQLVNIVKDVAEDLERGVCYLPEDVARREGVSLEAILAPEHRDAGLRVIAAVCDRADQHLENARAYTLAWPEDEGRAVRLFCTVPLALAIATLRVVREGSATLVPGTTPKISRDEVRTLVRDAVAHADDSVELSALFTRASRTPENGDSMTPSTQTETETEIVKDALAAVRRASDFLLERQSPEGFWKGELETNVTMDAEDLLLRQFLGIRTEADTRAAAIWIRSKQRPDGTWANAYGGPADLSTTVEAYLALKLAGDSPDAPHMTRAAEHIRREGGIPATRVFTRIWLALFGLWDWAKLPILPPEIMFLPKWVPLNPYDFACWARQTVVAMTVVMTYRPVRPIGVDLAELAPEGGAGDAPSEPTFTERAFGAVDRVLRAYGRRPVQKLRELALATAERWIVKRQEADGSWGGIQPPWVYSIMALHLRGYPLEHPVMRVGLEGLERFTIREDGARRLEACQSPVWDTAYAIQALADAGMPADHPSLVRAAEWILTQEVRVKGDWSVRRPELPPGGWAFEFANDNYPDIDDTAEVVIALRRVLHPDPARMESVITRAVRWTIGMQSSDDGWAAFDADNTQELVREIPFCDFGEVIDDPSADVTAHVIEMLANEGLVDLPETRAGVRWLLAHQEKDGSWFGRWGVNYVYGTGASLMALGELPMDRGAPSIRRAVRWLETHQNDDGGWGEDVRSYDDPAWAGVGKSTASQTAWAVLGLLAVGEESACVRRGIEWLVRAQRADGGWDEPEYTGTGFPGDFYINYHLYRQVFPTMALGRYARKHGALREGGFDKLPVMRAKPASFDVAAAELTRARESVMRADA